MHHESVVARDEDVTRAGERVRTPRGVRELVSHRLRAGESWQLLRVAAVLGRRFGLSELASMMRQSVVELLPAIDALLDDDVLGWAGDDLVFRTDLVWRAVLDALPPAVLGVLRADLDRIRGASRPAAHTDELSRSVALVRAALGRPGAARLADDLHGLLANLLLLKGESAAARATAERVLALPGERLADEAAGTRLAALALAGDPSTESAAEALLATAPPSSIAAIAASFVLSNLWWDNGRLSESLRMARRRADVGAGGAAPHWWLWQRLALINKLGLLRRLDEATALMRATHTELGRWKLQSYEGSRAIVEAQLLLAAGRLAAAATHAKAGVAAARESGSLLLVPHGLAVQAAVALRGGDLDTAELMLAECETARSGADCVPSTVYSWVAWQLAARRHGPRRAAAMAAADRAARSLLLVGEPGAAPWLVRTATAAGDAGLARQVVAEAEKLVAENPGFPTLVAAAAHARACLEGDAAALSRVVHVDEWAEELARVDLAELTEKRAAPRQTRAWASFSDVEQVIARLVSQGMTNRQIATRVQLSPHTVNYHLRVMFRKLGISSRAELVRHVPNSSAA